MSSLPSLPKCFLCQHLGDVQRVMPIDAKNFRETAHGAIYRCRGCGVGFIHPRPSPDTTAGFYKLDAYYTQGASHMAEVQSTFLDRLRTHLAWRLDNSERLVDVLCRALPPSGVVIDIGCGAGVLVAELTSRGHRAIGVERDSTAVSRGSDMDVREGSAEQLPEDLPAADAVVFSHVLEHLSVP